MTRQLILKEIIPKKKRTFKEELNEIILSLDLPKYDNNTGNKQFTVAQKLSCVILYFRSKLSLREFCDYFNNETTWPRDLALRYKITKSSLNRWVKEFDLTFIKKILDKTNEGDKPKILGIDGTGISSKYKSQYYQKRLDDFGQKPKSNYHKLDIIADLQGKKKIYDFTFTMKQYNDKKQAKQLFNRFKFKNINIIGDKGYYFYDLYIKMKSLNNILIVPPIKIDGKCRGDNIIRKKFQQTFFENQYKYSLRNNIEGIFSALKRTLLTKIVSKSSSTKKREVAFKIIVYNMKKNVFQTFFLFRNLIIFNKSLV
jgi:hypothetical protein